VDEVFKFCWKFGIETERSGGSAIEDGFGDNTGSFTTKRESAGGHFVEHYAEGEEIGAGVEFLAADLLGRHVGDGAECRAWTGEVGGANTAKSGTS
jgi:hypothetical protein